MLWGILIGDLGPNLFGFVLPFLAGSLTHLKWAGLIGTAGVAVALCGVFALTTPQAVVEVARRASAICMGFRFLASAAFLVTAAKTLNRLVGPLWLEGAWYDPPGLVIVAATASGLVYLRRFSANLSLAGLASRFALLLWVYLGLAVIGEVAGRTVPTVSDPAWVFGMLVPDLLIWVWALRLLLRLRSRLGFALAGCCIHCGYSLRGLPEPRCPECGRPTTLEPGIAEEQHPYS